MFENCECFKFYGVTCSDFFTSDSKHYQTASFFIPGKHFNRIKVLIFWQLISVAMLFAKVHVGTKR